MAFEDVLSELSTSTSDLLADARRAGWDMREETITELLLVALSRQPAVTTKVRKLSIDEEHAGGADFLWAIERNGGWLRLWCQAKKASGTAFLSYGQLAGEKAVRQGLDLMASALSAGAVPVYAFYNPHDTLFVDDDVLEIGGCRRRRLVCCADGLPWSGHKLLDAAPLVSRSATADALSAT